uniref:Uncharacterized protein n=1 Tax=Arundo donax TaxID=35708 RepID=A0A0A9DKT4_ARUDO
MNRPKRIDSTVCGIWACASKSQHKHFIPVERTEQGRVFFPKRERIQFCRLCCHAYGQMQESAQRSTQTFFNHVQRTYTWADIYKTDNPHDVESETNL